MLSTQNVQEIRSRFRIFQRKIFLNSCSQGALSNDVQEGLEEYIASWHEHGSPWELWMERYEQARAAFATFIHANPDEVAIVTSVSAGINGVASALLSGSERKWSWENSSFLRWGTYGLDNACEVLTFNS